MKKELYTINQLRAMDPDSLKEKEAAQIELSALEAKKQMIINAIAVAAKNGEIDTVRALQAEETAVDAVFSAKRETLEKTASMACFDRDTLKKSWNSYAADFNEAFSKKLAAFRDARNALAKTFLDLCELQRQAVNDVCHVNRLYSDAIPPEDSTAWLDPDLIRPETLDVSPMRVKAAPIVIGSLMIPPIYHQEDTFARSLELCGDLTTGMAEKVSKVICEGKPVQDPFI